MFDSLLESRMSSSEAGAVTPPGSNVTFSAPVLDLNYTSDHVRASTGMDDLPYWATSLFLDSVLQDDMIPPSLVAKFDLSDLSGFTQVSFSHTIQEVE